eukprot:COSAG04_NODE_72_length_29124_cov_43.127265_24_plen_158_part_01
MPDQLTVLGLSAGGLAATLWSLRGRSGDPTAEQGGSIVAHNNIAQWHEDNKSLFAPPICNKIMHKDDLALALLDRGQLHVPLHLEEELAAQVQVVVLPRVRPADEPVGSGGLVSGVAAATGKGGGGGGGGGGTGGGGVRGLFLVSEGGGKQRFVFRLP